MKYHLSYDNFKTPDQSICFLLRIKVHCQNLNTISHVEKCAFVLQSVKSGIKSVSLHFTLIGFCDFLFLLLLENEKLTRKMWLAYNLSLIHSKWRCFHLKILLRKCFESQCQQFALKFWRNIVLFLVLAIIWRHTKYMWGQWMLLTFRLLLLIVLYTTDTCFKRCNLLQTHVSYHHIFSIVSFLLERTSKVSR